MNKETTIQAADRAPGSMQNATVNTGADLGADSAPALAVHRVDVRPAFIGLQFEGLMERITDDTGAYLKAQGFKTPSLALSSLLHLWKHGPMSQADLARAYGRPHQLIAIRLKMLEKAGLAMRVTDPADKRRKLVHLTELGTAEAEQLWAFSRDLALAVKNLYWELGVDLTEITERAERALARKPLTERLPSPSPNS